MVIFNTVLFNKNKWIRTYLSDLLIDPLAHSKKYKKKPWNISVNDIVDSLRIDEIDMYVMSNEVADNPRTEHAIFAKTSAGEYCSYYFGDRGEGNHYYESFDPREGFEQYVRCMFYISH